MSADNRNAQFSNRKSQLGYGDYLRFRDLVLERSGLYFPEKKRNDLEIGILRAWGESRLTSNNGKPNLNDYYNLLRDKKNPVGRVEMERLINLLTIGETHFFRNEAQFNALATDVLPELIKRKRATATAVGPDIHPQLRIWSAGCASGEEAFSVAILLKELLLDIDNWHIFILATDINQDVLARAQTALYSDWSFREARAKSMRSRYFGLDSSANRYRLRSDIRDMVTFASLNLVEDRYPSVHNNTVSMDLILCRNVTIYFTEADTGKVIKRFYDTLVDGGWLVVGHSEPSLWVYRAFQTRTFPDTLFYQKTGQPRPWPDHWQPFEPDRGQKADAVSNVRQKLEFPVTPPPNGKHSTLQPGENSPQPFSAKGLNVRPFSLPAAGKPAADQKAITPPLPDDPALSSPEADPYEMAIELLDNGHAEAAIDKLHQKLAVAPNFAPAHCLLGRAYANLSRWSEARRWCESGLNLDTLQPQTYYVLALIYEHENQIDLAINCLKKAIYLERDVPLFHFYLAMLYKETGQATEAQRACRNAVRILERWPSDQIVPDTGGSTAGQLLEAVQRILSELTR